MASYSVAADERGVYEKALAPNTEDVVTFTGRDVPRVEIKVLTGATSPVYFTLTNIAATVKGAKCYDVYPGTAVQVEPPTSGPTIVRLISAAAAIYSVTVA